MLRSLSESRHSRKADQTRGCGRSAGMNGRIILIVILASIALTVALAYFSDGRIWFLGLPLIFGIPLLGRRRG